MVSLLFKLALAVIDNIFYGYLHKYVHNNE